MINTFDEFARRIKQTPPMSKERAYTLGYDCGMNGSNLTNCAFSIFSTPEFTKEWERGKKDGELMKGPTESKH